MWASRPPLSIADTPWVGLHNHPQPLPLASKLSACANGPPSRSRRCSAVYNQIGVVPRQRPCWLRQGHALLCAGHRYDYAPTRLSLLLPSQADYSLTTICSPARATIRRHSIRSTINPRIAVRSGTLAISSSDSSRNSQPRLRTESDWTSSMAPGSAISSRAPSSTSDRMSTPAPRTMSAEEREIRICVGEGSRLERIVVHGANDGSSTMAAPALTRTPR
mmetsp:Transcript_27283/g.82919  ORF Transcript_27283/g.82919 Transcript_27283/m.82919 type:complete len:220 (-) Transcript_27283:1526-2185(-)